MAAKCNTRVFTPFFTCVILAWIGFLQADEATTEPPPASTCTYSFTVAQENAMGICGMNATTTEPPPTPAPTSKPDGRKAMLDAETARRLLITVNKLLRHQSLTEEVAALQTLTRAINTAVARQQDNYEEVTDRLKALQEQMHLMTSGVKTLDMKTYSQFPNFTGVTNNYVGCPRFHPERIHEISPIRRTFRETMRLVPKSCYEWKLAGHMSDGLYLIDPDGIEGDPPFPVGCVMGSKEPITYLNHNHLNRTRVKGFEAPGSMVVDVDYNGATVAQQAILVQTSERCEQFLKWECRGATIFEYTWWVSRDGRNMTHWAGGDPATRGCTCGLDKSCDQKGYACNCDTNNDAKWLEDSGYIRDKLFLPVSGLCFGDTGGIMEEGYYTLGPLRCYSKAVHPYKTTNAFLPVVTWPPFHVYCDYDGWLLIMRHSVGGTTSFNQSFEAYRLGFGDFNGEFWLGLEKIFQITNQRGHRFVLQISFDTGTGIKFYAQYMDFRVGNRTQGFKLHLGEFSGSVSDELSEHQNMTFTAYDLDSDLLDSGNCAEDYAGGGWWYSDCGKVALTGPKIQWGTITAIQSVEVKVRLRNEDYYDLE